MAVTITDLTQGSTNYIETHNTNYQNIKVAVEALQAAIGAGGGTDPNASVPVAYDAMFGSSNAILGESSYKPTQSGADTLQVASGFAYLSADDAVVTKATPTSLPFSGQTTGTYYILVDEFGVPSRVESPAGALYSVDYNSATGNFDSIDRVANLAWTQSDWGDVQTDFWNRTVDSLDDRITAAEKTSLGVLQKTVIASNITLTEAEAFEQAVIQLNDGPQTANVDLVVPDKARLYQILNDCSSTYNVTVKTSGGAGAVVGGNHWTLVYCDAVNCSIVFDLDRSVSGGAPPSTLVALSDTPNSFAGHSQKLLRVNGAETLVEFVAPTYISTGDVTFENLDANGDVGTGATQLAAGDHTHAGYLADITGENFTDLSDTPADYSGSANYTVRVNGAGTGLEFVNVSAGATTFAGLGDTPANYSGAALQLLRVNTGGDAVEFFTPSYLTTAGVTFENLDANGDVGVGASQVAAGDHTHAGYAATGHTHVSADITDLASYLTDITGESFTDLGDTPGSYAGAANYTVKVNGAGTALEFVNVSAGSATFSDLSDTPANYTAAAKHAVKVNAAGDALEFVDDPYFTAGFFPGQGVASATMLVHVFADEVSFPSGLTGSQGTAETAATAQTDYDVQKNGASVGTVRFAAAATTATFIMGSATSFSAGDKLQLVAPGTLDSTLADLAITLRGTR